MYTVLIKIFIFSILILCYGGQSISQDIVLQDEQIYIGKDEEIGVYGDISFERKSTIYNNGNIILWGAERETFFTNNSSKKLFDGNGIVSLKSSSPQTIDGKSEINFHELEIENSSSKGVFVKTDVSIDQLLWLGNGIVHTSENRILMLSSNPSSIGYDDYETSSSYIDGNLARNMSQGNKYLFPIGDENFYHPISLELNSPSSSIVNIRFDSGFINNTSPSINLFHQGYRFDTTLYDGAWEIIPQSGNVSYNAAASVYNFEEDFYNEIKQYALVQKKTNSEHKWEIAGKPSFNTISETETINASNISDYGITAIAATSTPDLYRYNTIILDGISESRFILPGIEKYPDNHLTILSRWGNSIHEQSGYNNNFDFDGYAEGTYFYVFTYNHQGKKHTLKDFIEVVK